MKFPFSLAYPSSLSLLSIPLEWLFQMPVARLWEVLQMPPGWHSCGREKELEFPVESTLHPWSLYTVFFCKSLVVYPGDRLQQTLIKFNLQYIFFLLRSQKLYFFLGQPKLVTSWGILPIHKLIYIKAYLLHKQKTLLPKKVIFNGNSCYF